jgi:hypothetical protein
MVNLSIVYETCYFAAFVLVAKGWGITRRRFDEDELRCVVILISFFYLIESILIIGRPWIGNLFWLGTAFAYFVMCFCIFSSIERNLVALKAQLLVIHAEGIDAFTTPVYEKYKMFRLFRLVIWAYVALEIVIHGVLVPRAEDAWTASAVHEAMELLVFCSAGWLFRARPRNPFWTMVPETDASRQLVPFITADVGALEDGEGAWSADAEEDVHLDESLLRPAEGQRLRAWVPGMPLPVVSAPASARRDASVPVSIAPPSADEAASAGRAEALRSRSRALGALPPTLRRWARILRLYARRFRFGGAPQTVPSGAASGRVSGRSPTRGPPADRSSREQGELRARSFRNGRDFVVVQQPGRELVVGTFSQARGGGEKGPAAAAMAEEKDGGRKPEDDLSLRDV